MISLAATRQISLIMTRIKEITNFLEDIAPKNYQESYDNSGLIVGDANAAVMGVMICLDSTESVIQEAIDTNCNLVIAHHPIVFSGLKQITGKNYVERVIIKAIKNDIAIYAIHTNLDNVHVGVNRKIGEKLGLENLKILRPKKGLLSQLVVFTPKKDTKNVLKALNEAGAGNIGNYKNCSFRTEGTGTFEGNEHANPTLGTKNKLEEVSEDRIEVIFPSNIEQQILSALKKAHPYEEIAYYLNSLGNINQEIGAGMVGNLPKAMGEKDFLIYLKEKMQLDCIRHTPLLKKKIEIVAFCGGAGSFLLQDAIREQADVFITGDFKYHEFFDADSKLIIMDIGHYESEVFTKELIYDLLNKNFTSFALHLTKQITNPISYF